MRTIVRGACPLDCPDTCSWDVEVEDGRAVGLRGDREHPFTRGALCRKVNHYLDAAPRRPTASPTRCAASARRARARFERSAGTRRSSATAAGMQRARSPRHGPESVLPYYFAGTDGHGAGLDRWARACSRRWAPRGCGRRSAPRRRAPPCARPTAARSGMDPEDIGQAQLVILWGANLLSTNVHQWRFVLEAQRNGAHVVASTRSAPTPPSAATSTSPRCPGPTRRSRSA